MNRLRNLHPGWIAAAIAVAVALWLGSGLLGGDRRTQPQAATEPPDTAIAVEASETQADPVDVQVRVSEADSVMRTAVLAGRTAAVRKVKLRAQIRGRVAEVVAERGEHVAEGDVIVRLDRADLDAQLAEAEATLEQRRLQYQAAQEMAAKGYQTAVGVATARANLEAARAAVARIRTQIDYTTIEAPFAGVLEMLPVEVGDVVAVGDVVGQVIQQDPFIVWGNASEDVVPYLEAGQAGTAILVSGEERRGTVRFISSVANEATRTYRVELQVDNPEGGGGPEGDGLIAGASAELHLPLERVPAHKVEPAILTLNAEGVFGIKSVAGDGTVRFHEARIVRNRNGSVWLAGLPETLRIITVGQGFVRPGDPVDVSFEDGRKTIVGEMAGAEKPES